MGHRFLIMQPLANETAVFAIHGHPRKWPWMAKPKYHSDDRDARLPDAHEDSW